MEGQINSRSTKDFSVEWPMVILSFLLMLHKQNVAPTTSASLSIGDRVTEAMAEARGASGRGKPDSQPQSAARSQGVKKAEPPHSPMDSWYPGVLSKGPANCAGHSAVDRATTATREVTGPSRSSKASDLHWRDQLPE
ncbi:uncharacterized protein LOC144576525 [Callithrix jacchus]